MQGYPQYRKAWLHFRFLLFSKMLSRFLNLFQNFLKEPGRAPKARNEAGRFAVHKKFFFRSQNLRKEPSPQKPALQHFVFPNGFLTGKPAAPDRFPCTKEERRDREF